MHSINILLLLIYSIATAETATPIWEYLSGLCPPGLVPLTKDRNVKTCEDMCPRGAQCIQGICCTQPPQCRDLTYKYPSSFVCLPSVKQNCPPSTKCVPSTRQGQSMCCSTRTQMSSRASMQAAMETGVCPASHPVLGREEQGLQVCRNCRRGLCVPFRGSDVHVCCHTHAELCGAYSEVEMNGVIAKDCTDKQCAVGFECRYTAGLRVCCSYPKCANGMKSTRICAGGCGSNEKCESIDNQKWCCPISEEQTVAMCPGDVVATSFCSLMSPKCPPGMICVATEEGTQFICCEDPSTLSIARLLKGLTAPPPRGRETFSPPSSIFVVTSKPSIKKIPQTTPRTFPMMTTRARTIATTPFPLIMCNSGFPPLRMDNIYLRCPEVGAPCPKAGYICQPTNVDDMFCCPMEETNEIEEIRERTTPISVVQTTRAMPWMEKMGTTTIRPSPPTLFPRMSPRCPFGYHSIISENSGKIRTCAGWLDFSCPLTYSCLPSSTTPSFVCCTLTLQQLSNEDY